MLSASTTVDYPYYPFRIPIDFVLVNDEDNKQSNQFDEKCRDIFEKAAQNEGLIVKYEKAGHLTFTMISTPFHRLCREAEMSQMCFPLKECQIKPSLPSCCISLSKMFVTDDTVKHVNAPFQRKNAHLFVNYTKETKFFTSAQRGFLTNQILNKIDISKELRRLKTLNYETEMSSRDAESPMMSDAPLRRKGLRWLLMKKVFDEAFVLHAPSKEEPYFKKMKENSVVSYMEFVSEIEEDPRKNLSDLWEKFSKFQPLNKIRNYFGEQIAYYFAWQGTFITLLWPATIFGLFVFVYGFIDSVQTVKINWIECDANVTSSSTCHPQPINRLSIFLSALSSWFVSSFDTEMNAFFAVFMSIWGSVFVQIWRRNNSVLSYRWNCEEFHSIEPDRPEFRGSTTKQDPVTGEDIWISPALIRYFKMWCSFLFVTISMIFVVCSLMVVTLLKIWLAHRFECRRDAVAGDDNNYFFCWLLTAFLPSILNTSSMMTLSLVYSRTVEKLNQWENHRTETEHQNSLIVKIFAFQIVNTYTSLFYVAFFRPESHGFQTNGLFGLGEEFKDTCQNEKCASLLAVQLLTHTLIKPIPKFFKDVVLPYFVKLFRVHRLTSRTDVQLEPASNEDQANVLVREWLKPSAGDFVLWEMNEKIIMFGTTMMFASLFPLSPLFSLIIGFVDMRIDAHRLVWFNRKPTPQITNGIGIWLPILTFLQYSAVFTNAFIVAFTSDFCSKFFKNVLSCNVQNRLVIVIVFQNFVFILKYFLSCVIPSIPSSIKVAKRKKHYIISHIIEKGDVPIRTRQKKKTRFAKIAWITSSRRDSQAKKKQRSRIEKKQLLS